MQKQSRRNLLKNAVTAAAAVTGGAISATAAEAQASRTLEKKVISRQDKCRQRGSFRPAFFQAQIVLMAICFSSLEWERISKARSRSIPSMCWTS